MRQTILPVSFALLVGTALLATPTAAQNDPPAPVQVTHLTGPLHALLLNGQTHVVASVGADGILLVDTGYVGTAEALREALGKLGSGPIRVIINTHGDGDHVGGNAALGAGAMIIAHRAARRQMAGFHALPSPDAQGLPTLTTEHEATLHFNNEAVRLVPVSGCHTAGDLLVHFVGSGVICVGDLVLGGTFPNADPGRGGDAQRLLDVLRELRPSLLAGTTLLPGHGAPFGPPELGTYIGMIDETVAAVRDELAAGHQLEEILKRRPLSGWAKWESPRGNPSSESWTAEIHDSLTGRARRSICVALTESLMQADVGAAVATYRRLKAEEPQGWRFAENELNRLGYELIQRGRVDDAIVIFELNVEVFPEAFNTHDSLGEAYMRAGRKELAIASYERSLERNPDNANAVAALARLREE